MRVTIGLGLMLVLAGCGSTPPPGLAPAPSLTITVNGNPGRNLDVRLYGSDGAKIGSGQTGDNGRAAIRGATDEPVPPGTYKVCLIDLGDEGDPMSAKPLKANRIPATATKPGTTTLSVTIESGKMEYTVELKSK